MRGAAAAVGVLLGHEEPQAFGVRLGSWADLPGAEATDRLRGALSVAGALLQSPGEALTPLLTVIEDMPDDTFVRRLPALRGGFDALSPADRDRLLQTVTTEHGEFSTELPTDATTLAAWLAADRAGAAAIRGMTASTGTPSATAAIPAPSTPPNPAATNPAASSLVPPANPETAPDLATPANPVPPANSDHSGAAFSSFVDDGATAIGAVERWRLLLGRESERLSQRQRRLATALDELYGAGRGEGAYTVGGGGGQEAAYPEVRDWLTDVEALFGADVRDEVLARAAEKGRLDALMAADPDRVRASVDLLHAVLSLAGGLPEARLAKLRPLVARLTDELTARLARRIRPALTGIGTPRPTLRPTGRLDLAATVRRNLHTVRADDAGRPRIVPERPVFRSRGRRSVDWQVILLVDVSGSMEESTIWAALTASVLAGVPALRTHFVTFSTEVIDLTDRVTDPLSLLLGIRVGGGTHIAAALRYARQMSIVPARTMVVTISDFEEGFPIGDLLGATRALVDDGMTLLGCASLDDRGRPRYSTGVAGQLVAAGMPVAALSPLELAGWIGDRVR
ncbi:VWA domain-containing protein [Actinoplanes sp. LDG1-01]|uniref:VWA domain-containing protein n=2 Tax=Paractinoplanes lichenicola TaxID=2802976 RepID=A0ABS1VID8_9ACTN|nr:VWA domain-containing protein [Actinoplanes lichenicola]